MSRYANVHSIEVLKHLRASLTTFVQVASAALDETGGDIRRTTTWLRQRQYPYWKKQLQVRNERFVQAKLALSRKEVFDRAVSGSAGSCVDEKRALRKAEKQLREAELKVKRIKAWTLKLEKASSDYRATVQGLVRAVEVDIPNARARLDKMIESLEAYVDLAPPEIVKAGPRMGRDMDFVWTDAIRPAVDEEESDIERLEKMGVSLRKMTPSARRRRQARLDRQRTRWIASVPISDGLRSYIRETFATEPQAEDDAGIVVALPATDPHVVYVERPADRQDRKEWYIGTGDKAHSDGYAAIRMDDLVQLSPGMADVLNVPAGHLIVIDISEGTEAVLGPDGQIQWHTPNAEASAFEEK